MWEPKIENVRVVFGLNWEGSGEHEGKQKGYVAPISHSIGIDHFPIWMQERIRREVVKALREEQPAS